MTESERLNAIRKANDQWKAEHGVSLSAGLMDYTKEDVQEEAKSLDALDHADSVDFDNDENEVNMTTLSPTMREVSRG